MNAKRSPLMVRGGKMKRQTVTLSQTAVNTHPHWLLLKVLQFWTLITAGNNMDLCVLSSVRGASGNR